MWLVVGFLLPLLAFAQQPFELFEPPANNTLNIASIANKLSSIANSIIPFLIGIAVVAIIWGIFRYIAAGASEEQLQASKKFIIYGIIGLFIILSFWGLVFVIATSLGIQPQ